MYQGKRRARQLMTRYGIKPSKRLSQNFMISDHYLSEIAGLVERNSRVLEIGMGLGNLTEKLTGRASLLISCDLDPRIKRVYADLSSGWRNVDFVICDGKLPPMTSIDYVVSNMPYGETSKIIMALLTKLAFGTAVLTLQKEVAERLAAKPGSSNYGRLSVMVQCAADVDVIDTVPPHAFFPRPKVYSAIVRLRRKRECMDLGLLERFTSKVFTQPNKVLRKVVRHFYGEEAAKLIESDKRVYELAPSDVAAIMSRLGNHVSL